MLIFEFKSLELSSPTAKLILMKECGRSCKIFPMSSLHTLRMLACKIDFFGVSNKNRDAAQRLSPIKVSFNGIYLSSDLTLKLTDRKYKNSKLNLNEISVFFGTVFELTFDEAPITREVKGILRSKPLSCKGFLLELSF